jgi:hypothetical protein
MVSVKVSAKVSARAGENMEWLTGRVFFVSDFVF